MQDTANDCFCAKHNKTDEVTDLETETSSGITFSYMVFSEEKTSCKY